MKPFRFGNLSRGTALRCGVPAGTALVVFLLYLFLVPGDSMEPGAPWKIPLSLLLYTATLAAALWKLRRPARLIYFAFPLVLAVEEALNHEYFAEFHDEAYEPVCDRVFV